MKSRAGAVAGVAGAAGWAGAGSWADKGIDAIPIANKAIATEQLRTERMNIFMDATLTAGQMGFCVRQIDVIRERFLLA